LSQGNGCHFAPGMHDFRKSSASLRKPDTQRLHPSFYRSERPGHSSRTGVFLGEPGASGRLSGAEWQALPSSIAQQLISLPERPPLHLHLSLSDPTRPSSPRARPAPAQQDCRTLQEAPCTAVNMVLSVQCAHSSRLRAFVIGEGRPARRNLSAEPRRDARHRGRARSATGVARFFSDLNHSAALGLGRPEQPSLR
jgi:hypothetical protein